MLYLGKNCSLEGDSVWDIRKKNNVFMPAAFMMAQAGYSIYFGFLVSYLTKEGMNSTTIGFILMLCALFNLVSQPLLGYVSDTYIPSKRILMGMAAIGVPLSFVLPLTIAIPVIAVFSIVLMAMIEYSFANLFDSWIVQLNEKIEGIHYPFAKGMASFGYALASLIVGKVLAKVGTGWMFAIHAVVMGLLFFLLLPLEELPCRNKRGRQETQNLTVGQTAKVLLYNQKYVLFVFAYILVNVGMRFITSFYPTLIATRGGNEGDLGVGFFLCSVSEVPFIFLFSKLSKQFCIEHLMLFSLTMFAVKNICMYLSPNVTALQLSQLIQGPSFGIYLPAVVMYMRKITLIQISATALMLLSAVTNAVGSIAGNFLGGIFIDTMGIYPSVLICITVQLFGAALFFFSLVFGRGKGSRNLRQCGTAAKLDKR